MLTLKRMKKGTRGTQQNVNRVLKIAIKRCLGVAATDLFVTRHQQKGGLHCRA